VTWSSNWSKFGERNPLIESELEKCLLPFEDNHLGGVARLYLAVVATGPVGPSFPTLLNQQSANLEHG